MSRYFITVHDAVHLVLLASTMADKGEIYTLDMGEPVEIATLARRAIEIHGLRPDQDIDIQKIGIRPGEKLHESPWEDSRCVSKTDYRGIYVLQAHDIPERLEQRVLELEQIALEHHDDQVISMLRKMPLGYGQVK
jgi:FlaA1/EpsC-like NDP-sugar epimerase